MKSTKKPTRLGYRPTKADRQREGEIINEIFIECFGWKLVEPRKAPDRKAKARSGRPT